jgi:cation transport ATPase
MIEREKVYNVDAIEKNDIIRLKPGRLLLDVIIFSGTTKAIESVMNGSEDSKQYQKGDRLRSGSVISETDSLAQVENVFEKSVLLEIGSQINMANNNE